jgi:hypothetical protein
MNTPYTKNVRFERVPNFQIEMDKHIWLSNNNCEVSFFQDMDDSDKGWYMMRIQFPDAETETVFKLKFNGV